ncbi:MAG: metal-dependent transcriptional regulator [Bacteroidota bacterium]
MPEKTLSANMEDYLEAIGTLTRDAGVARVKEISEALNVKTPSVHAALHLLVDKGLIEHEHYGYVRLTETGAEMAEIIIKRHEMLEGFLRDFLGVSPAEAGEDACRIEHVMSEDALARLERFIAFLKERPEWKAWSAAFHASMKGGE